MLYPIKAPFKNEFEMNVLMHRKIKKKTQPAELHYEKCWEVFLRLKYLSFTPLYIIVISDKYHYLFVIYVTITIKTRIIPAPRVSFLSWKISMILRHFYHSPPTCLFCHHRWVCDAGARAVLPAEKDHFTSQTTTNSKLVTTPQRTILPFQILHILWLSV